jgi:hypothetical protein
MPDPFFQTLRSKLYRIERDECQSFRCPVPPRAPRPGNRISSPGVDVCVANACKEQIMHEERGRKVETSVEARAGFLDRPVLIVLGVSLALGLVVLGALWLGFFGSGA